MNDHMPYKLIRCRDDRQMFGAVYVKYFPDGNYCALFEEYPAAETRIMLCRKVSNDTKRYGARLCKLMQVTASDPEKQIGFYVTVCEARSEAEVSLYYENNLIGNLILQATLGGG